MEYFFYYVTELPETAGFMIFGIKHLIWLVSIGIVCIFILMKQEKQSAMKRKKTFLRIGNSVLFMIFFRLGYLFYIGHLTVYELPLHLCALAGFFCFVHSRRGWNWLAQTLYAACLPGTITALLFPNWTAYPAMNFLSIQGFVFHGLILLYCLLLLREPSFSPQITKIWQPILVLALCAAPIYFFDIKFHANYMFLQRPSARSPLVWIWEMTGSKWYLVGYAVLVTGFLFLMYLFPEVRRKINSEIKNIE